MGPDGIRFFTELKSVTAHWFGEEEEVDCTVDTWDGMIEMPEDKK
jgi:malonate-semialdehyde dehydrogenase (acetylating)/methylmalonate-semialdehyde dehydrogenase